MDPLLLLILMLKQKDVLNDNEMTWVVNANMMSVDQSALLQQDGEDRTMTFASMRVKSFQEARKKALDKLKCPYCDSGIFGEVVEKVICMPGKPELKVNGVFTCTNCHKDFV